MQEPRGLYPALLEPVPICRRRQLPQTPARRSRSVTSPPRPPVVFCRGQPLFLVLKMEDGLRFSSPRILPTPPPLSPDFRCPSAFLERRPSGRILPRPPTAEPGVSLSGRDCPWLSLCGRPNDPLREERKNQEIFQVSAVISHSPNSPRSPRSPHSLSPDVATPEPIPEIPLIEASATDSVSLLHSTPPVLKTAILLRFLLFRLKNSQIFICFGGVRQWTSCEKFNERMNFQVMTSLDLGSSVDHQLDIPDTPDGTQSKSSSSNSIEQVSSPFK